MGDEAIRVGVLTVSDRVSDGTYEDRGGPAVVSYVVERFISCETSTLVVPDEMERICSAITQLSRSCCLVLTTGGTGPAPRDVTPEATEKVCEKLLPGFGEKMRADSWTRVPTAILSRQTAGILGESLVVNLPGSIKAIPECLDAVLSAIPHAVRLAGSKQALKLKPEYHRKGSNCKDCGVSH